MKKIILNIFITTLAFSGTAAYANTEAEVNVEVSPEVWANTRANVKTAPVKPLLKSQEEMMRLKASSTLQMEMKNKKASSTKEKSEMRKMTYNRFENMIIRFGATIEREESILARIVSRIEKVKTAGGNATKAEKFISDAKMHLDEAKTTLAMLKANAEITAELETNANLKMASTTRDSLANLRKISQELEKHLREAHKALVDAVSNLLGMSSVKPKIQATTTSEVNVRN